MLVTAARPLRPDLLRARRGGTSWSTTTPCACASGAPPEGDWGRRTPRRGRDRGPLCRCASTSPTCSAERQGAALEALAGEAQASLDLEHGPLLRAVHFTLGAGQPERLLIAIHHLVVDAVSWRILLEDLQDAYLQLEQGQAPRLRAQDHRLPHLGPTPDGAHRLGRRAGRAATTGLPALGVVRPLPVDAAGTEANVEGTAQAVVASLTPEETQALLQDVPRDVPGQGGGPPPHRPGAVVRRLDRGALPAGRPRRARPRGASSRTSTSRAPWAGSPPSTRCC